ncbi:MAG: hypothetical protein R3C28_31820 [Pirellulaceae bacterium]
MPGKAKFCNCIRLTLEQDELEPILKYTMLNDLIYIGMSGSLPMELAFGDLQKKLDAVEVDDRANWLKPDDLDAAKSRQIAQACLDNVSELTAKAIQNTAKHCRQDLLDPHAASGLVGLAWAPILGMGL